MCVCVLAYLSLSITQNRCSALLYNPISSICNIHAERNHTHRNPKNSAFALSLHLSFSLSVPPSLSVSLSLHLSLSLSPSISLSLPPSLSLPSSSLFLAAIHLICAVLYGLLCLFFSHVVCRASLQQRC